MARTTDAAAAKISEALAMFGATEASRSGSTISHSQYLEFDGIPTRLAKSARREFFTRFPKANGAGLTGRFTVRISDHGAVSCREASMASVNITRDVDAQIAEVIEMVKFLMLKATKN